jgi:predicted Zn-dependent peptidase
MRTPHPPHCRTVSTLSNGLRVVQQVEPAVPIVGIALYYDVGSRNEEPGRSGFAHLFEHMMFQGSAHVAKGDHFALIQGWGGQANGTTSQDRTNYYCSLPASEVGLGLWLEADRMRSLLITPENFENQRQTVMEERRERVDNAPYGKAALAMQALSYRCWAYAHPVIGEWADLEEARYEEVLAFHRRWYRPDNAVLALAGDIDATATLAQIEALFGDIPAGGPRPQPDLFEPPRQGSVHQRIEAPLARLGAVSLNHPAPDFDHPDFPVFEVLEALLFRGSSSRIWRRLVVDSGAAVQLSGGYECHRGPSAFGLFGLAPRGGSTDRIVDLYEAELMRLIEEPVPEAELQRVVNQLRAAKVFASENMLGVALSLGRALLFHDEVDWEERQLARIAAVTPDDLRRVAAATFTEAGRVRLDVVPA